MQSITKWFGRIACSKLNWPTLPLEPLPEQPGKKLWLTPEAFVQAINGLALAHWAVRVSDWLRPPRLARGPGGRPQTYKAPSVLLMAVVQTGWRMAYSDMWTMCEAMMTWLTC